MAPQGERSARGTSRRRPRGCAPRAATRTRDLPGDRRGTAGRTAGGRGTGDDTVVVRRRAPRSDSDGDRRLPPPVTPARPAGHRPRSHGDRRRRDLRAGRARGDADRRAGHRTGGLRLRAPRGDSDEEACRALGAGPRAGPPAAGGRATLRRSHDGGHRGATRTGPAGDGSRRHASPDSAAARTGTDEDATSGQAPHGGTRTDGPGRRPPFSHCAPSSVRRAGTASLCASSRQVHESGGLGRLHMVHLPGA